MPINIPKKLPARELLESENIFVMDNEKASKQDIRPLNIAILNLMPKKIETETQILRVLSNSPIQVNLTLLQTASYTSKNTPHEHLTEFYKTYEDVKEQYFDGLIITGAPVEEMEFEQVNYWDELVEVMKWSDNHAYSTFHICWGAQAGLYYHYGIKKQKLDNKVFGVFEHQVINPKHKLVRGFDEFYDAPHSRHTVMCEKQILDCEYLEILSKSKDAGINIVASKDKRQFFVTSHSEYDRDTLNNEYQRDVAKGLNISVPKNYYPKDDPSQTPFFNWRGHAHLLFMNWLNYFVYQATPFDFDIN